jgi:hypothetical protein
MIRPASIGSETPSVITEYSGFPRERSSLSETKPAADADDICWFSP